LTFLGATSERASGDGTPLVVIDIGGGSTELVVGADGTVESFVSLQAGVVRQSERHLHCDPPASEELQALTAEVREVLAGAVPAQRRERVQAAIAVAGTATSCAAIELELDPYDPERVHGHQLQEGTCELLLAQLATMTEEERRGVVGLQPDRAPTIVAGVVMLLECMRAFGLDHVEVSEHDLLRGAALDLSGAAA
ncbi:MAG: Ppx/GppA family phosphatase, partial [Actinomycetota bacterium]|nr:Ppx/GppA family phosphatase [Actinomycetota bacterium]